ncbi:ParB N-terminal domain-containing protein [Microbacterium sp. UCD-TDU]|uniref:ParB N-terminal domain-containing protein n=1 Tax=Microbacterium sp. UCD-TDU TaxID=1247714 RepID=UPI000437A7DD|nr:ParB/RepB/Spo0J family partition protein [Microbacterium sp. UCD-TDU]EYT61660.1 hypothetical protein D514_0102375 [Microbacterium sp. UCD-TDU]
MSTVQFQTMPPLSPDEYRQLEVSCLDHGIQIPILVDENGTVIDGHHRQKIAQEHGLYLPTETRDTLTDVEKTQLSISLNIDRRQLTREQRREIIAASLRAEPRKPDYQHAKALGVSPTTVGTVRRELQESGDVSKLETRIDSLGRTQPAEKPRPAPVVIADTGTGLRPDEIGALMSGGFIDSEDQVADLIGAGGVAPKTNDPDGKSYARKEPRPDRRKSIVDDAYAVERDLYKYLERLRTIIRDDRFNKNKANIQDALRPVAGLAREIFDDLFDNQSQED